MRVESVLAEIDQIDLVHRDDDVADAEQRADERMPPRLDQDALARIDQNDRRARAVEAPVAMLRVYCSCPGVSATMNERRAVAKNR